ncbi:MAG TPA: heavy metal-associated domain-containing protein [Bacteroidota bacterium]|nr:heavy metal-associated domain-containing protein [Bacteroidota bacterium]
MKKNFFNALVVFSLVLVFGCSKDNQNDPTKKTVVTNVSLPSMVCSKCANTIQKAVYHVDGVKDVEVDVDKKTAEITYVPYQTNVETIERAINEAGYDANNTKRDSSAYEGLEKCCKING